MKKENQEKIRCTIRVTGCTGGHDPESPQWPTHEHMILIDILDQGSEEGNEKSVLENLNKGEFTIELDEEQDGIEKLKKLFNKKSVIKYFEDALTSDLAPGIILSKFLNDLQDSVRNRCFNIYVMEWGNGNDDDDGDDDSEYPNNINEDAFDETIRGHSGGYKTIVFEKLEN